MKMLVVFGIVLHVSLHSSLAAVIEVYGEAESALLPCFYGGSLPEKDPSVIWSRNDRNPKVFQLREGGDDPGGQNQIYKGRTSMTPDALQTRNFSLTFSNLLLSDSGNYICSISDGIKELKLTEVQLNVKDDQVVVNVRKEAESVVLPCKTSAGLPKDTRVEWIRSEPEFMLVYVYPTTSSHHAEQHDLYHGRTRMNEDLLRTGNLSLTLEYPTDRDHGRYICTVHRHRDILRQRVALEQVQPLDPEGLPTWSIAVPVVVVLLVLLGSAGLLYHFRHHIMSEYKVKVDSGKESVLLPCRTRLRLPGDARVKWKDRDGHTVHTYEHGSDHLDKQYHFYRERTKMNEDLLDSGDLSLTLKHPTDGDSKKFTCVISDRHKNILMKKQVDLQVKVPKVEVDSGVKSVLLLCRATIHLHGDSKIEWRNRYKKVHVYENGSDQLENQSQFYRNRTKMNEDLLRTGDLSLTLEHPTDGDSEVYTCSIFNREGNILMKKQVDLHVKVCQVEVEEGAEFVLLPFVTTPELPEDVEVEWRRGNYVTVHVYQRNSDLLEKQNKFYRNRTQINEDFPKTGDISLILRHPRKKDSGQYRCEVFSLKENLLREKTVLLKVKERPPLYEETPLLLSYL